ncbi:MAG TPA: TonB-dependent receptor, partial [Bryobacteraceae bacterium]|nr:TonB-dependent receptor [Bryobacteraceae bacterium]
MRLLLVLLCFVSASLLAQVAGRLTGSVVDSTGASVPNAKVALYLPGGKAAVLTTSTNSAGIFDFIAVRPDLYMLEVESSGFAKYSLPEVKIDPARQASLPPISLSVMTSSQTVEITGVTQGVDLASAEVATTVSQAQITNLPVIGRQITNLFVTQAGVTQNNRQNTVINGMRPSYSNVMMDGINVQDSVRTNDLDLLPNRFTIAQIAEFTVSTTNSSPTIGGAASTITLVSPSGTNEYHGSAYWFNRNKYFSANDWFNNKNGVVRPALNLNQIGATFGGAIIKDKLFFFGNYEAYRFRRQSPISNTILTPTARQGILQYRVGNTIQQFDVLKAAGLTISPAIKSILALVPEVGNNSSRGDGLNTTGYTFNGRSNTNRDNVLGKGDFNLSPKHVFSGTYAWNKDVADRPVSGSQYTVEPPYYNDIRGTLVSGAWRWTPTPALTNELRAGFNYLTAPFKLTQPAQSQYFLFPSSILGSPFQTSQIGEGRTIHQYNLQNNANWVHGR